jgi:hypothetical protein
LEKKREGGGEKWGRRWRKMGKEMEKNGEGDGEKGMDFICEVSLSPSGTILKENTRGNKYKMDHRRGVCEAGVLRG